MAEGELDEGSDEKSGNINGCSSSDEDEVKSKRKSRGKHKKKPSKKHKSKGKKRRKRRHKSPSSSGSRSRSRSVSPKTQRLRKEKSAGEYESSLFRSVTSQEEEEKSGLNSPNLQQNVEQKPREQLIQEKAGQSELPEKFTKDRSKSALDTEERNKSKELSDTSVKKENNSEPSTENVSLKKRKSPNNRSRSQSRSRSRQSRSGSEHKRSPSGSHSRHRKSKSPSRKRSKSHSQEHGHRSSPRRRRSRSHSHSRRRSRSPRRSRAKWRSRSRSRQRSNSRSRPHSRSSRRRRSYSRSRRPRSHSRHRSRSWSRNRRRSRSPGYSHRRDRSRSRAHRRRRIRSRSRSESQDKKATKDSSVSVPVPAPAPAAITNTSALDKPVGPEKPALNRVSGRKSIAELTAFCKKLTEEKAVDNGAANDNKNEKKEEEENVQARHHPFLLKPAADIYIPPVLFPPVKPVRLGDPSKPLPEQFPVSCGSKHREKEIVGSIVVESTDAIAPPQDAGVFNKAPVEKIDISALVVKRMEAQRRLTVNPDDLEATLTLQEIEMKLQNWCQSNVKPGQFTGQLVKSLLPSKELQGGQHAWARKDMFQNLLPLSGGVGMMLMQKMGWQPGQVLGKRGEGYAEPITVQIKIDRKGLSSNSEKAAPKKSSVLDVQGKHPVSALSEYCSKRKWPLPDFKLIFDHGAPHSRQFLFKVIVNDMEYQPTTVSGNKKQAKAEAAVYALKALGLMPENAQPQY